MNVLLWAGILRNRLLTRLIVVAPALLAALLIALSFGQYATAQEEVWESYNNNGIHCYDEKEYGKGSFQ